MVESRSVRVVLAAKVDAFKADMAAAGKAATDAAQKTETAWDKSTTGTGKAMKAAQQYSQEMTTVGTGLAAFGGVVVGALGLATKATMSWESAWTGVLKTVDGTPKQLAAVESGLRDLAKTLPATHEEIAAVAEAAGQLGIKTDNVVSFTKTMIDMGESTNLSAEEAATSLARLANIMGTSQKDFGKMGASIVGLGNNFATTEREIVEMSMRIAGAGKQAGLTEGDVFGLSTALSSVGIEAEAGGTAISMVMKKVGNSVADGGDSMAEFARIAGMSTSEFSAAWKDDASGALDLFIQGLGRAQANGENVNKTLSDLGITGIRESDALLRLSASGDVLTEALKMGNSEYERGAALAMEAAKRYDTDASRLKMAGNTIKDTAITVGGTFAPMVTGAMELLSGFIGLVGSAPEPILQMGGALGGLVGAASLAGGGFLVLAPRIAETIEAVNTLRSKSESLDKVLSIVGAGGKTKAALTGIAKAAGLAAGAWVLLEGAAASYNAVSTKPAVQGIEDVTQALIESAGKSDVAREAIDKLFQGKDGAELVKGVDGLGDAIDSLMYKGDGFNRYMNEEFLWGVGDKINEHFNLDKVKNQFDEIDQAAANMADSGSMDLAAETFKRVADQFVAQGYAAEDAMAVFPELQKHYQGIANDAKYALSEQELLAWMMTGEMPPALAAVSGASDAAAGAIGGVGGAANEAAGGLAEMLEGLLSLGIIQQSEMEAMSSYEAAIDGINEAVKENGRTLDITTEKGRNNQDALFDIADAGRDAAEAMAENGASQEDLQKHLQRTYDDLVSAGKQFGLSGEKAKDMARKVLGIPDDVSIKTWMSDAAEEQAKTTKGAVDDIPKSVTVQVHFNVNEPENGIKNMPENLLNPNRNRSKKPGSLNQWEPNYYGGIDLMPMAVGGVHNNIAEMVKPNTWRIVGDRMDVDEAFIPLDGSRRSWKIMMEAISRMPGAMPMAKGGIASAQSSVDSAENRLKAARRAKQDAKSKSAKATATRRVRTAEDELAAAKKSLKAAKEKAKDDERAAKEAKRIAEQKAMEERERKARVNDLRTDLRVDLRRGNIRDQVTGGLSGGYSAVDRLYDLGSNQDLSRGSRSRANSSARKFEANLRSLYAQAERIDNRLKKAQDKATELNGIKDSVASSLLGGRDLDVGTYQTRVNGQWQSQSNLGQAAKGLRMDVGAMKAFAGKLKKLTELGIPGAIIQEIAQAGPDEGSNMADSFIGATKAERKSYLNAWSDYEKYANQAGQYVTEGFYKGGSAAADGVVKGLEGKQKNVESAIANLAKVMESTFKQVLGIHSPSTEAADWAVNVPDGMAVGLLDGVSTVQSAAAALGAAAIPSVGAMSMDVGVNPVVADDEGMAGLAMQDMSTTTLEVMQAMGVAVSDGFAGMLANTQAAQAQMLLDTQLNQTGMLTATQAANLGQLTDTQVQHAAMLLDTQTQQEAMRATVLAKQTGQRTAATEQQELMRLMLIDKQSQMLSKSSTDFESLKSTTGTKFSDMRKNTDGTMSGMYKDYDTRLVDLKGLNKRGFESLLSTSNSNMEGIKDGIDGKMGEAKPVLGNRMNALIGVLSSFTASVNKAFGDVGVKLDAPKSLKFADGGVLPGYTPGRDIYKFHNPALGNLELSGGEGIIRPEGVRYMGGAAGIDRFNRLAKSGMLDQSDHFADGGVLPTFAFANGGTLTDAAKWWQSKGTRITEFGAWGQRVGRHSPNSLHYSGRAFDANYGPGGQNAIEQAFFDRMIPVFKPQFPGIRIIWRAPGHYNHAHFDNGGGADIGSTAGGGSFMGHPFLDRAGVTAGSDLQASYAKAAEKLTQQIYAKHASQLPDGIAGQLGKGIMSQVSEGLVGKAKEYGKTTAISGTTAGDPAVKAAVRKIAEQMGWGKYWGDIDWLVNKESSWNPNAANPSSSARGLFQKMTSLHGPVEDTVEGQARWGLNYIKSAYGNPAKARAHHQRSNWYEGGTERAKKGLAVVGEEGPELVNFQGGEQVMSTADSMKFMAANRTYIPTSGPQFDQAAFTNAVAGAVQANGINPNDLADALSNMRITFNADGQQFTGAVTAVVGSGYDQSRSRLSKSSQKIGAR
ncbi:phage tail tape measure protein [Brevibacterium sediminis]|uniref:phage tail tape measure protein n=1 Tax=Brevibacterium sediminis TaxID=1857024 RepID=UPI00366CA13C